MKFSNLDVLLEDKPYTLSFKEKQSVFMDAIKEVTEHHIQNCKPYKTLCEKRKFDPNQLTTLYNLPYLPVSIFKDRLLLSMPEKELFREINSSATTSGKPSRIGLDRSTSKRQSKCFNRTILDRLGNRRRRFVVLDTEATISKNSLISARSSTIRSLLFTASEVHTCMKIECGSFFIIFS